jgi:hypothetical protein
MRVFLIFVIAACIPSFAGQGSSAAASSNFEISGAVVNAINGETVRHATLTLSPTSNRQDVQTFETGTDGRFSFPHLVSGKYSLSARARGFPQQFLEEHEGFTTAVAVGAGKSSTGIIFKMNPDAAISGQVLDEHNEAARETQVMLFSRNTDNGTRGIRARGYRMTDDQGRYHFNHLSTGIYYLAASAQPWFRQYVRPTVSIDSNGTRKVQEIDPALDVAYPITYYPNTTDADGAGAVMLHPGDRISADFALTPVRALHVTVRTNSHSPQPNAMFMEHVFGNSQISMSGAIVSMRPDAGEVEVTGLAPGSYTIRPRGRGLDGSAQEVDLRNNTEIDGTGASGLEKIQGHVTFEGTAAPKRVFIQLLDADSEQRITAPIQDDGNFEMTPSHAGKYSVVIANTPRFAIRNLSATGAKLNGRTLEFTGAQPVQLTITAVEGMGTINGTVIRDGNPVSGAMVVLVPADPANNNPLFRRDQSDSDGTFTLSQVVPGKYKVVAIQNGWDLEWATPEVLRPYLGNSTAVEIDGKKEYDIKVAAQ